MKSYGDYVAVCDADENRRLLAAELTKERTDTAADAKAAIVADGRIGALPKNNLHPRRLSETEKI